jgi:5-methylcytosine-specific restriction protein A
MNIILHIPFFALGFATRRCKMPKRPKRKRGKAIPVQRGRHNSFYASAWWRRTRKAILLEQPWCRICGIHPSEEVDHIRPHRGDEQLKKDTDNLQGLCKKCHSAKTARGE